MKKIFLLAAFLLLPAGNALADWVQCKPVRVAVKSGVIHIGCEGDKAKLWYGIRYTKDNTEFVNRLLSVATTATVAGKNILISVNPKQKGDWRDIAALEIITW